MSCPVDSYYSTAVIPPGSECGACGETYDSCGTGSGDYKQPSCCPDGYVWAAGAGFDQEGQTECQSCHFEGVGGKFVGKQYYCFPKPPSMDDEARANCCTNMIPSNINGGKPGGYCRPGWCPDNDKCKTFMTDYCVGSKLKDPRCIQFCKSHLGACDVALKSYCSDKANFGGVCGCAMPIDQYPLTQFSTPDAPPIPVKCNKKCALDPDAVPLLDQPDCNIGTICVINNEGMEIAKGASVSSIKITQNCGNTNNGFTAIFKKYWYVFLIIFIVLIVLIILLVVFV